MFERHPLAGVGQPRADVVDRILHVSLDQPGVTAEIGHPAGDAVAPVLAARTAPGGKRALAGILDSQAAEVRAAYTAWLDMRIDSLLDGWALLAGSRR